MTTATKTLTGPKLWLQALYTIPRVDPAEVDPVTRWLILGRVSVVVMTAISAVIGGLLAVRDDVFDLPLLILVAVGLVLAHTGSNLVNDFWDFQHGIDTPDSPRVTYGPHPFTDDRATCASFCSSPAFVLAAATVIGVYLVEAAGSGCSLSPSGAFVLLFYSGGPFPLKYIGLGEIAVFIVWGPLMIGGTYYVMAEELPGWVLLASVPYGLGVTTVLFGKHLDKLDFDKEKGIRTMPIVLGEKLARHITIALSVADVRLHSRARRLAGDVGARDRRRRHPAAAPRPALLQEPQSRRAPRRATAAGRSGSSPSPSSTTGASGCCSSPGLELQLAAEAVL